MHVGISLNILTWLYLSFLKNLWNKAVEIYRYTQQYQQKHFIGLTQKNKRLKLLNPEKNIIIHNTKRQ